MTEQDNYRMSLSKGKQRVLFEDILKKIPVSEAAQTVKVSERTIRDWRREKYRPTVGALKKLCKKSGVPFPRKFKTKTPYSHTKGAGRKGWEKVLSKYGRIPVDETRRLEGWRKWWDSKGKTQRKDFFYPKKIKVPEKTTELAEFIGIMIGDGGVRPRQVVVTLNSKDDSEYADFVSALIEKLFDVPVSRNYHKNQSAVNLTVSRTRLVNHCVSLGLKKGNKLKKGLDIPGWVKKNKKFQGACMRGLMDTDGCIFEERHNIKKKTYSYPRLHFVSASETLLQSVFRLLKEFGFEAKIRNNRAVTLEKREDIVKYFGLIGSSNPKHIEKYNKFIGGDPAG